MMYAHLAATAPGMSKCDMWWCAGPAYAENRDELYDRAGGRLSEGLMPESDA